MGAPAPAREGGLPASLLVVDDDPAIGQLLTDLLTEEHYRVRTAADGRTALAAHRAAAADLIISDVMMPGMDGPGLVAALRAAGDMTPVVLLSALPPPHTGAPGTVALRKPFDLDRLLTVIARLLAERSMLPPPSLWERTPSHRVAPSSCLSVGRV